MSNTSPLTCIIVWDGEVMQPTPHFTGWCQRTLVLGHAYRISIVPVSALQLKRTLEQNNKMWAMLEEFSKVQLYGRHYSADEWKTILMHGWGKEGRTKFLPALDGSTFVPYGGRSSKLTIAQMSEFIEYMYSEGIARGVCFADLP